MNQHTTSSQSFDAIIAGGGMVGLSLAIAASQSGLRVAVIEPGVAEAPQLEPDVFSPRVSAVNHFTRQWFESLGVWQQLPRQRLCGYRQMHVWDGLGQGQIAFDSDQIGHSELGHIVENRWLLDAMLSVASRQTRLELMAGHRLATWNQDNHQTIVQLEDGTELTSTVLAGCDGRHSKLREQAGIDTREWPYHHTALVTSIKHQRPHQATARQVFLDSGPLALLPLNNSGDEHWSSIVWSADTHRATELLALDDEAFKQALHQASEGCLGDIEQADPRHSFPLSQMHAKDYYKGRLVLLGDAAHAIHPLAGQGANLGFQDAKALSDEWARAHKYRLDLGERSIMRRYQRQRQTHNLAAMAAMDGFKRLFQSDQPLAVLARNIGMSQFNRHPLIKRPMMLAATGQLVP